MSNNIFVLSAPAGTGKTTIAGMLTHSLPFLKKAITTTTRLPRVTERNGVDYYFVTEESFDQMEKKGEFVETVYQYGFHYGTTKKAVQDVLSQGNSVLLVIDTEGAKRVLKLWPEAVLIFVKPPSIEELTRRLVERKTESEESLERRLDKAKNELLDEPFFHYSIVNDRLDDAYQAIRTIITKRNEHVTKT